MRPPVDHVRISAKAKDILIRVKKRTGLEHWNEICRVAYCRSLANPLPPTINNIENGAAIDIEWKTFAGHFQSEITAVTLLRAEKDGIDMGDTDAISNYFRAHLDRGIISMQNIKNASELIMIIE